MEVVSGSCLVVDFGTVVSGWKSVGTVELEGEDGTVIILRFVLGVEAVENIAGLMDNGERMGGV